MSDRSVNVGVKLTVEDAKKSAQDLKKHIDSVLSEAGKGKLKLADNFEKEANECIKKAEKLSSAIDDVFSKGSRVASPEYRELYNELDRIEQKKEELKASSGGVWKTDEQQAEYKRLLFQMEEINQKLVEMRENGSAFKLSPEADAEALQLAQELANVNNETRRLIETGVQMPSSLTAPTFDFASEVRRAASNVTSLYKKMISLVSSTVKSGIQSLTSGISGLAKGAQRSDFDFKKLLTTLVKYGLGMRSLYMLFRKLRSAVVDGIKSIAEFNGGANSTATALNALQSSLSYLKGSWAAAFAPIIEFVTPYLTALIDKLAEFANMLGAIFALFTGKKIMIKATKQTAGAADATAKGAAAQKEWNNELYAFDELNKQSKQSDSSSGGGGGGADFGMEEVDPASLLPEWLVDLIDKIKELWNAEKFYELGKLLSEYLTKALWKLDDWINDVFRPWGEKWAKNIAEIINGFVENWELWEALGQTIADGIEACLSIASTFLESVHWDSIGKGFGKLLKRIFADEGMWNEIARFIAAKFNALFSFIQGFLDETISYALSFGERLWRTIANIVKSIKWDVVADDIIRGVKWIIQFIKGFLLEKSSWQEVSDTIVSTINRIITEMPLEELGKALNELLMRIVDLLSRVDWYQVGYKIGQFLGQIDWVTIMWEVGKAIVEALWGAIMGFLSDSHGRGQAFAALVIGALIAGFEVWFALLKLNIIKGIAASILSPMAAGGTSILGAISATNSTILGALSTAGSAIWGAITGFFAKLLPFLQATTSVVGTIAVGLLDAFLIPYDVVKLNEAFDTFKGANEAHMNEQEKAMETYRRLYETKGKEVADEWAKTAYDIDTTNMSLEEAQAGLTDKISELWDGVPQDMWQGFSQGWNQYFGSGGSGLFQLISDAFGENGFIGWIKNIFGISSPSTVMEEIGANVIQGFLLGIQNTWESVVAFGETIIEWVSGLFTSITETISTGGTLIFGFLTELLTSLSETITMFITNVALWFTDMMANLSEMFTSAWEAVSLIFSNIFQFISESATAFIEFLSLSFTSFMTSANELFTIGWTSIQTITTTIWTAIQGFITSLMESVRATLKGIADGILGDFTNMWNTLSSTTMSLLNALKASVISLWNGLKSSLKAISFKDVGTGIVNGIKSGIESLWSSLKENFLNKIRNLVESAKNLLRIGSPSKVFAEIGQDVALGMAEGITKENSPEIATQEMVNAVKGVDIFSNILPDSDAFERLSAIADKFQFIGNAYNNMANMPIPAMATAGVAPSNLPASASTSNVGNDIANAITSALGSIQIGGGNQNPEIKIYIRGKEVFDAVVAENNSAIMRTGQSPLVK